MSNIVWMNPQCAPPNSFETVRGLHALYERLGEFMADALELRQKLDRAPDFTDANVLRAQDVLQRATLSVQVAAEQILDVVSQLIVETTVNLILESDQGGGSS
jgi:hypothetical protein